MLSQWQDTYYCQCITSRTSIILETKRGMRTERRVMNPKMKIRITTTQAPWMHTFEKLQCLKIQTLQAMDLALALMSLKLLILMFGQQNLFLIYWQNMPSTIPSGIVPMHVISLLIPWIVNSAEALEGSHIVERVPEYILCKHEPVELHTTDACVPPISSKDDGMYLFMNNYNK